MTISSLARAIGGLVLLGVLPSCQALPVGPFDRTQAEADIRGIEETWAQIAVTGEPAVMEWLLADEFVGVSPEGQHYNKRDFIDETKAHPLGFSSNELNEVKIRFFGNVAVAQGDETFTRRDGGQGRFVWTDVLVRRDTTWQIIAAQDAVAGAATSDSAPQIFSSTDPATAGKLGIATTRNGYMEAWRAADAERIARLYAVDAVVMYPNQEAVTGRDAIAAYFKGFFEAFPRNEFELVSSELTVTGDWAFDRGTYRWKGFPRDASQPPEEDHGKYLVVLQRLTDGTWVVARDMDNSDRPVSQSTRGTH